MKRRGMIAELVHLAGDEDASFCRPNGQRLNHGAKRLGIGVVAVIEDGSSRDLENFATFAASLERLKFGDGRRKLNSRFPRHRQPGYRILRIVGSEKAEPEMSLLVACAVVDLKTGDIFLHVEDRRI